MPNTSQTQSNILCLFEALDTLDFERQQSFERIMIALIDKLRVDQRLKGEIVRLGAETIIRLMAEHNSDDIWVNHETLGRAYRSAVRLSPTGQNMLVNTLLEPVKLIHLYCDVCNKTGSEPLNDDIRAILEASFSEGAVGGHQLLESLVGPDLLKACLAN
jgi:hypothetical protein